jgi:hypothetical protein
MHGGKRDGAVSSEEHVNGRGNQIVCVISHFFGSGNYMMHSLINHELNIKFPLPTFLAVSVL